METALKIALEKAQIDRDRIIQLTGLPEHKILNIYMYGSRVYGTYNENSDYDFLVLANSLEEKREVRDCLYNVHTIVPNMFYDDLNGHKMQNLECLFAPDFAKIQESREYSLEIDFDNLKKRALAQSYDSWHKGKYKLNEGDIYRGKKSMFHSIRILCFARQIVRYGKIKDFSEANKYWYQIDECEKTRWNYYSRKYFCLRRSLIESLTEE
jgi:predicted nucleotidyltransferase